MLKKERAASMKKNLSEKTTNFVAVLKKYFRKEDYI